MAELGNGEAVEVANQILASSRTETARLDKIHQAFRGEYKTKHYVPKNAATPAAEAEYKAIIDRSKVPILDLPVLSLAQNLFVDGYRPAKSAKNSPGWEHWQANRMDMKQSGLHVSAITYGASYLIILPGEPVPVWRPVSPRRLMAVYEDRLNDEFPIFALESWSEGSPRGVIRKFRLYDSQSAYTLSEDETSRSILHDKKRSYVNMAGRVLKVEDHNVGVCPVVRYMPTFDLDEDFCGFVEPLIPFQEQVDASTYYIEMAQQYAVHRQRWVTGMAIPEDKNGKPVEPFRVAIDRMLHAEDADTKFGEFAQSDIASWLEARKDGLRNMAIKSQTPPANLLGDMINMSAEALAAAEAPRQRQASGVKTSFGESHEQAFRLDARIAKDEAGMFDLSSQVVWRDLESRSLAQVADALGKLAQQLGIPPRALWERIPGVTEQDLARWEKIALADEKRKADAAAAAMGMVVEDAEEEAKPGDPAATGAGAGGSQGGAGGTKELQGPVGK